MALDAVAEHYRRAGWSVLARPEIGEEAPFFRPDLLLQRKGRAQAVLVRDEPPTPFELGQFANQCKRHDLPGLVVSPPGSGVEEACELHGLELHHLEGFYAAPQAPRVTPSAPPLAPAPTPLPPRPAPVAFEEQQAPTIPWWRWGIVAVIWAAALWALSRLIVRVAG